MAKACIVVMHFRAFVCISWTSLKSSDIIGIGFQWTIKIKTKCIFQWNPKLHCSTMNQLLKNSSLHVDLSLSVHVSALPISNGGSLE